MNISGVEIGAGQPCRFVAEMSNAHNGSFDRAIRLIDAAKAAGTDFIKFQCYTPDELVALRGDGPAPDPWGSEGWSMHDLYTKAQTPHDWFPGLVMHCQQIGMPWFSSVFGAESLALLESLGCPAYKIARLDNAAEALAMAVERAGKPMIFSEAYHGESAIVAGELAYLYCPPGYPQERFAFGSLPWTDGLFPARFDGFSYHGTDPLPCIVAATLGAKIIEAHFQLDHWPSELEANVSLTASAFREMVDTVRKVEGMLA